LPRPAPGVPLLTVDAQADRRPARTNSWRIPTGFLPGDRYAVEIVRPIDGEGNAFAETVSFDPAQPTTTMRDDPPRSTARTDCTPGPRST
jgi:hypothetical protein